jgi:hypothetical protein
LKLPSLPRASESMIASCINDDDYKRSRAVQFSRVSICAEPSSAV